MISCTCLVQEGQLAENVQQSLEAGLSDLTTRYFNAAANVVWLPIRKGNGYTAGVPSTSSLCSVQVPDMDQSTRVTLLSDICDLWMRETQCSINEIVASAPSSA